MLDTIEMLQSVYGTLRASFPGISLWDKDVDKIKDTEKPCFVVEADNMTDGMFNSSWNEQNDTIAVYYLHDDRNNGYAELLRIKKRLTKALTAPHNVDGFVWSADNIDYAISRDDMALTALFDLYAVQEPEDNDDGEAMEELEYREEGI